MVGDAAAKFCWENSWVTSLDCNAPVVLSTMWQNIFKFSYFEHLVPLVLNMKISFDIIDKTIELNLSDDVNLLFSQQTPTYVHTPHQWIEHHYTTAACCCCGCAHPLFSTPLSFLYASFPCLTLPQHWESTEWEHEGGGNRVDAPARARAVISISSSRQRPDPAKTREEEETENELAIPFKCKLRA